MALEAQGVIHAIFPEKQVSEKFRLRDFVLEMVDGTYTQFIKFQLSQDKCSLIDQFKVGDKAKVLFNLAGKPFEKGGVTTYFTNLNAWRIEKEGGSSAGSAPKTTTNYTVEEEEDNSLPF